MSTGTPQIGSTYHLLPCIDFRIYCAFALIVSGAFVLVSKTAYAEEIPVPQKKPAQIIRSAPTDNSKQASDIAEETLNVADQFNQCVQLLSQNGIVFGRIKPFVTELGCEIADPVVISAIQTDTNSIKLSGEPLLSCQFAVRLVAWIRDVAAPVAYKFNKIGRASCRERV